MLHVPTYIKVSNLERFVETKRYFFRCYITLTQSLHLIMGGAPQGFIKIVNSSLQLSFYAPTEFFKRSCGHWKDRDDEGSWQVGLDYKRDLTRPNTKHHPPLHQVILSEVNFCSSSQSLFTIIDDQSHLDDGVLLRYHHHNPNQCNDHWSSAARAIGIMVYVFNCSEQMDYKSCGNIFKAGCLICKL